MSLGRVVRVGGLRQRASAVLPCLARGVSSGFAAPPPPRAPGASDAASPSPPSSSPSSSSTPPPSASGGARPAALPGMTYRPRWRYAAPFRSSALGDYLCCRPEAQVVAAVAHTYRRAADDVTVTLIPLRHMAHPEFFLQVDALCRQHDSVLMEGRAPLQGAPHSTMVPPRPAVTRVRPPEEDDSEGWEPREQERFFQPFSWGVAGSPRFTVVHAADRYDYERLPWWCTLRFNAPLLGSLARERHCLDMIAPLREGGYRSFAVPWGAAHMPIFHEMLLDSGFECVGMSSLLVLRRLDGDISEGEYDAMARAERWRARRAKGLYAVLGLAIGTWIYRSVTVTYNRGPSPDEV